MATYNLPGVYRREVDVSDNLVPNGISIGGTVVRAPKGRINYPVIVTSEKDYIDNFGKPIYTSGAAVEDNLTTDFPNASDRRQVPDYGYGSYAALEFLKESSQLVVVRGWSSGDHFSNVWIDSDIGVSAYTSAETGSYDIVSAENSYDDFDKLDEIQALDTYGSPSACLSIFYNNPSVYGDDIAVTIEPFSPWCDWRYSYDPYPSNDVAASSMTLASLSASAYYPIAEKVFKLNVYKKEENQRWEDFYDTRVGIGMNSDLSATADLVSAVDCLRLTPVETFYGSLGSTFDSNNNDLSIEAIVNGVSNYIYVKTDGNTQQFDSISDYNFVSNKKDIYGDFIFSGHLLQLANGASSQSTGIGSTTGWSGFENRDEVDVNILINPDWNTAVKQEVARIAQKRMDCIAVGQVGTYKVTSRETLINSEKYGYVNPSYMALYAGYSKIRDKYNNKSVYIPNAIFGAALFARTDRITGKPWMSPAGDNRGIIPCLDQNKIFKSTDLGLLHERNINVVKFNRGVGFVMWTQKTAQLKESALNRISVRRLLLYIENNVEKMLNQFIQEKNNDKTRLRAFTLVDDFMKSIYSGDGVYEWRVICDESNNTADVIDANQFKLDLALKPQKDIEIIIQTVGVASSGVNLTEIVL